MLPHGARKDWGKDSRALLKAIGKESIAVLSGEEKLEFHCRSILTQIAVNGQRRDAYVISLPSSRVVHTCIALYMKRAMHVFMYSAIHEYMLSYIGIAILLPYLAKQRDDSPLPRPEFLIGSLPKGIDFGFLQAEL